MLPESLSFSARITWCLRHTVLRGPLSLSDMAVGTVGHFCVIMSTEGSLGQRDTFLSAGDSQHPHSTAGRLRVGSGTSREPVSDSPLGYILRNWKILTLQKAWPQYKLGDLKTKMASECLCQRQGKCSEVPYVQSFVALSQNPDLRGSCRSSLSVASLTPVPLCLSPSDFLDDPYSTFHIPMISLKGF